MNGPSHGSSQLGDNDLEEDYPCISGQSGTRNLTQTYTQEHQLCTGREGYSVQSRFLNSNLVNNEDIGPQPHPYEGYKYEFKRLETFNDWPSNAAVKASDLAKNGFIYTHINDRVQCAFCRGILSSWEAGDVVEEEHKKHCPECAFAFGYECGNVPLNQSNNVQATVARHPTNQYVTAHSQFPQTVPQHGNFSYNPSQSGTQPQAVPQHGNFSYNPSQSGTQSNLFIRPVPPGTFKPQPVARPTYAGNPIPQQIPPQQRIQVRPESSAEISFNRPSGSLNIYSGNVTLTVGNQEDAIGTMPSLPVQSRPAAPGAPINTETIITSPKYPKWENESVRLRSYTGWPTQMSQVPKDLAQAGLLYMGSGDRVKCFWCGGELHDWEPQDIPMEEHAKWFTICGFVRKVMGDDYIQKVKDKQNGLIDEVPQVSDIFSHPHVLAVIQHGYSREHIQAAFDKYGKDQLYNAQKLIEAIERIRVQQDRSQTVSTSAANTSSQTSQVSGLNLKRAWTESVGSGSGAMEEGEDIAPSWLVSKKKDLYSPGEDEGIVADDVEMEDMECKDDQSIITTENSTKTPKEIEDKQEIENKSKESEKSEESSESSKIPDKGHMIKIKNKKDIDPVELENEKLKDQKLCKICMDKELAITFLPCGHLATCEECSKSLEECPICRKPITQTVKVYWS